jgi:hypothetical protein
MSVASVTVDPGDVGDLDRIGGRGDRPLARIEHGELDLRMRAAAARRASAAAGRR